MPSPGLERCRSISDGWGLDVVIGGSQKAFMVPPGVAFLSIGPKAWKLAESATLPHYYFDLKKEKRTATRAHRAGRH